MEKPLFTPLLAETLQHCAEGKSHDHIADLYGKKTRAIKRRLERIHQHFNCHNTIAAYRLALLSGKMPLR